MFNKILVCLDGSDIAEQILPYVSEEATKFDSHTILLHVYCIERDLHEVQPITYAGGEEAKEYLDTKAQMLREKGIKVECATVEASCAPESSKGIGSAILYYAHNHEIDLIAIATHGRSGWRRVVFGSIAEFVLEHSSLPILLVRPKKA